MHRTIQLMVLGLLANVYFSMHALAATVQLDGSVAISISELEINGTLYNANWIRGNYFELINAGHVLLGNQVDALLAVEGMVLALETAGATEVRFLNLNTTTNLDTFQFVFAYNDVVGTTGPDQYLIEEGPIVADWTNNGLNANGLDTSDRTWGVLTPAVVPLPAAMWLFGASLGLLAGWRRQ